MRACYSGLPVISMTRLRTISLSVLALLMTIGSCILIGMLLRPNPKTMSLLERVETERVIIFLRTSSRETLESTVSILTSFLSQVPSIELKTLNEGKEYELAVLRSGGNAFEWIIYVHRSTDEGHDTYVSSGEKSLFLPLEARQRSFARSLLLQQWKVMRDTPLLFLEKHVLPLSSNEGDTLIRSLLGSPEHVLLLPQENGRGGRIVLLGTSLASVRSSRLPETSKAGLLHLSVSDMTSFLHQARQGLEKTHAPYGDGLRGILLQSLESFGLSTSLGEALGSLPTEFFAKAPIGEKKLPEWALMMDVQDQADALRWMEERRTSSRGGIIREQSFMKGENIRKDVVAPDEAVVENDSSVPFIRNGQPWLISRQGKRVILKTEEIADEELTKSFGETGILAMRVNVPWALFALDDWMPGISESLRELLVKCLGNLPGEVMATLRSVGSDVVVLQWGVR